MWKVQVRTKTIGHHIEVEKAARLYDQAARETFGKFAKVNFPLDGEAGIRHY